MTNKQRTLELIILTSLILLTILGNCWAPTFPGDPPTTPVVNPFMGLVTIATMAVYGFWKMRK